MVKTILNWELNSGHSCDYYVMYLYNFNNLYVFRNFKELFSAWG